MIITKYLTLSLSGIIYLVVHYVDGSTDTIEARSARNINSKMVFTIDDTTRYIIPDKDSVKYLVIIKDTAN